MSLPPFKVGGKYSKKDISKSLNMPSIAKIREGIYNLNQSQTLFFVDLEKSSKQERFHFDDFFEGEFFHWDSQTTQSINSPKIQELIKGQRNPYLFARIKSKVKNNTQPFIYCGQLRFIEFEEGTSNPVHMIFQSLDFNEDSFNEDLLEIYRWRPQKIGGETKTKISKRGVISEKRRRNYKKPNITERSGLVVSRVGQGYFRELLSEKWNFKCPVTGVDRMDLLVASHIVPWAEASDEERLDIDNGILLSPNIDALFDRHLISFEDTGEILISNLLDNELLERLGVLPAIKIPVSEGMKKYLGIHRLKLKMH